MDAIQIQELSRSQKLSPKPQQLSTWYVTVPAKTEVLEAGSQVTDSSCTQERHDDKRSHGKATI